MNREALEDYKAKESEDYERYRRAIIDGKASILSRFPSLERFGKTNDPIVLCDRTSFGMESERIWSQIPFAGTTIVPIQPFSKEHLLLGNGFDVDEIPLLLELVKREGKVQFGLGADPLRYAGLDHLDPILDELHPPNLSTNPYGSLHRFRSEKRD